MSDLKLTVQGFIDYVHSVKRLDRDVILGYVAKLEREVVTGPPDPIEQPFGQIEP